MGDASVAYDFHELQTIRCLDAITLRVPARWQCGPDRELTESWCCCREGEESGTLWITLDRFRHPEGIDLTDADVRQFVDGMVAMVLAETPGPTVESEITEIDGGYLWRRIFDGVEGGEELRYFRYKIFKWQGSEVAIADFNLVVVAADLGHPEFVDLANIMDREIRAAGVEPFA